MVMVQTALILHKAYAVGLLVAADAKPPILQQLFAQNPAELDAKQ